MRVGLAGFVWRPVFLLTIASFFLAVSGTLRLARASPGFSRTGGGFRMGPPAKPCAHRGDQINSISARAIMAGTVFDGKARSRSVAREPGGFYGVTFVVQHVYKDRNSSPLRPGFQVRLQFRERRGSEPDLFCRQSYNFTRRPGELVRTNIKRGGKYIVFVMGVGPHNFTLLGEPVFRSSKNLQAVTSVLCHNCLRPASVSGLEDVKLKEKDKLRLVCRCKGNPLPALAWFKNGKPVNASRSSKITFKKQRSSLVIPKVRMKDGGRYECRGTSVTGETFSSWSSVSVSEQTQRVSQPTNPFTDNTTTLWPLNPGTCPIQHYCLNGGTCAYYETVGELVCQCAEGYKGQRCESKDVYNRSSMYMPYFCKLGISSSYYC